MKRHILTLISLIFAVTLLQARQLDPEEALIAATAHNSSGGRMHAPVLSDKATLVRTIDMPGGNGKGVYLFNCGDDGFMALAADDAVPQVLLGYSDQGSAEAGSMPESLEWLLNCYAAEVEQAAAGGTTLTFPIASTGDTIIEPLLSTHWNQDDPYNDLCPAAADGSAHTPTGCVATAVAQVMKYNNWPRRGAGTNKYKMATGEELEMDFSTTAFRWEDMLDDYEAGESTESQRQAVATLMYAIGVSINMNYGPRVSTSNYFKAAQAMVKYFGYDPSMKVMEREFFTLHDWNQLIISELKAGRPVLYGGSNSKNEGHAFVIDGSRPGGYYHVNWGWGGVSDGYFLVSALDPLVQGIGGSAQGYDMRQNMVVGICPLTSLNAPVKPTLRFIKGFAVADTVVARNKNVVVEDAQGIISGGIGRVEITPGLMLENLSTGERTHVIGTRRVGMVMNQGIRSYPVQCRDLPRTGTYRVSPGFITDTGEWTDAMVTISGVQSMIMTATPDGVHFSSPEKATLTAFELSVKGPVYVAHEFPVSALLKVVDGEYYGEITPVLLEGTRRVATAAPIPVCVEDGSEKRIDWISSFGGQIPSGEFTLSLSDNSGQLIASPIDVVVYPDPEGNDKAEAKVTMLLGTLGGDGTYSNPYIVDMETFTPVMEVTGVEGYFAQSISAYVMKGKSEFVKSITAGFVGLEPGKSETLEIVADLTDLDPAERYMVCVWGSRSGQLSSPVFFKSMISPLSAIDGIDANSVADFNVSLDRSTGSLNVASPEPLVRVELYTPSGVRIGSYPVGGATTLTVERVSLTTGFCIVVGHTESGASLSAKIMM